MEVTPGKEGGAAPVACLRQWEKRLARIPPARVLASLPRTVRFAGETLVRGHLPGEEGPPVPGLSPGLLANVAMDEAALLAFMGPNRFPRRADYERVRDELAAARGLYAERGWLADPASYHRTPPGLERLQIDRGWAAGVSYERFHFDSGYEPHDGEPGRDRWVHYATNRVAGGWMLRHEDGPRPWVVCVHGFGMGYPFMAFHPFDAPGLHRDLGVNVIGPTLPLHGRRKVTRLSGEAMLSFDLMNSVLGLAQSVWDLRRLLTWVRAQEPASIAVYGISLGAYVASLLVTLDPGVDTVVAGVPVVDFPALYHAHAPSNIRLRVVEHEILGGPAEDVHRVVSPLSLPPLVPREGRFVFAGLGDRMAYPTQAWRLWKHWDGPEITWYPGSHMGFLWSGEVRAFVRRALARSDDHRQPAAAAPPA